MHHLQVILISEIEYAVELYIFSTKKISINFQFNMFRFGLAVGEKGRSWFGTLMERNRLTESSWTAGG